MIRAGTLRHRIAFQQESAAQDASGQSVPTWAGVPGSTNVPAEVMGVAGGETFRGQQVEAHITSVVNIRYRHNLHPTMRIKMGDSQSGSWNQEYLYIDKILDRKGHKRELEIHCTNVPTLPSSWTGIQTEDDNWLLDEETGDIILNETVST